MRSGVRYCQDGSGSWTFGDKLDFLQVNIYFLSVKNKYLFKKQTSNVHKIIYKHFPQPSPWLLSRWGSVAEAWEELQLKQVIQSWNHPKI